MERTSTQVPTSITSSVANGIQIIALAALMIATASIYLTALVTVALR